MYLSIIFLPLLSSIYLGFFSRWIGRTYSLKFSIFCMSLTTIFSCYQFIQNILQNQFYYLQLINWICTDNIYLSWGFLFDSVTIVMLFIVSFISLIIHIYSLDYMKQDPHQIRFISFLSLFTFFMLILITSDNFLQMFVGWEGVGICSFLLINFWYTRIQANKAAIKAMLINRIGDFGLLIGILTIFLYFNSLNYAVIFNIIPYYTSLNISFYFFSVNLIDFITFFLFIGAIGKSAQLGLHAWLPDAMEGPTPVSALLHSATMVTAGVFLLIRISPLLEYSNKILFLITIIGAVTAFFAATIGLFQNDIKRIIAYSTCSQLGYMIFACGLSNYNISLFHLSNHAFFKALLFLCSGIIIHALYDEQDIRKMGSLQNLLPFTYLSMLIASLALIGFPFLSGFYSKDLILETTFSIYNIQSLYAYILGSLAAFCTSFYSFRLIFLIFLTKYNGFRASLLSFHYISSHLFIALLCLVFPSIFFGYIFKGLFISIGTTFWGNSIFLNPFKILNLENEYLILLIKQFPFLCTLFGSLISFFILFIIIKKQINFKLTYFGLFWYNFFNRKWFFDKFNNLIFSNFILNYSYLMYQLFDKGIIEFFGPSGLNYYLNQQSKLINTAYTNPIYFALFILIISFSFILILNYFYILNLQFFNSFSILFILFLSFYYNFNFTLYK